jgi:hypothetical protein
LPNWTEVGFTEKDWPGMNVTVTLLAGGGGDDGAVEDEEHAATQKPRTNAVKSRIMIVAFHDRNEDSAAISILAVGTGAVITW